MGSAASQALVAGATLSGAGLVVAVGVGGYMLWNRRNARNGNGDEKDEQKGDENAEQKDEKNGDDNGDKK
jgi:hypothetical protein